MSLRGTVPSIPKSNKHKASGPDQMTSDLFGVAPVAVARHMHPLLAKAHFTAAEPHHLKGGPAHPPIKARGKDTPVRDSFREIMLKNDIAKHHPDFLRSQLFDVVGLFFLTSQQGCLPAGGSDLFSLTGSLQLQAANIVKRIVVLFPRDILGAFCVVIRELLLPCMTKIFNKQLMTRMCHYYSSLHLNPCCENRHS